MVNICIGNSLMILEQDKLGNLVVQVMKCLNNHDNLKGQGSANNNNNNHYIIEVRNWHLITSAYCFEAKMSQSKVPFRTSQWVAHCWAHDSSKQPVYYILGLSKYIMHQYNHSFALFLTE